MLENKAQKKDGEVRGALLSRVVRKGFSDKAIAHKGVKVIKAETSAGQKRISDQRREVQRPWTGNMPGVFEKLQRCQ